MRIIGWWHSHGKLDTFHSPTDQKNQLVLLNQIAPSNYIPFNYEDIFGLQSRIEGDKLVFFDNENPNTQFYLDLKNINPELVAERLRVKEEKRIGFCYSFVVNAHRWMRKRVPYCEIATRDLCRKCLKPSDVSVQVGYRVFDDERFVINDDELLREIGEKVHVQGEYKPVKKQAYLPSVFEEQRSKGELKKPELGHGPTQSKSFFGGIGNYDFHCE